jgi:hypothetical protein
MTDKIDKTPGTRLVSADPRTWGVLGHNHFLHIFHTLDTNHLAGQILPPFSSSCGLTGEEYTP